ncbi:MAG TPA: 2TM domain-containing protein [Flavobacteriaceae bacterium]|nr:2TM domain-containing protein [Flavobacteriaceae bacterium]
MNEREKSLKFILILSVLITGFILLLNFVFSGFDMEHFQLGEIGITFLYVIVLTCVNAFFFRIVEKKMDWETQRKKRMIVGIFGSIFLTIAAYFFCRMFDKVVLQNSVSLEEFWRTEDLRNYLFTFLLIVIITLALHVFFFFKAIQENKVKEQKIIAGTASAKFDALKNQLDPHFLFNSLNVLTSLIDENPQAAQKFTSSLSKIYRYVLEQKNKDLVSVEEELEFAETYIGLLKMRFENSILFEIPEKIGNSEAKIVPLALQLLLENAVKHNRISDVEPLRIQIYEEGGMLIIKNNLQSKKTINKSSGIGLWNIRQRYHLLTARKVEVYSDHTVFKVALPMLTKQVASIPEIKTTMENKEYLKLKRAKEKVEKIKGFYGNITSYIIIIPFLAFVNYFTSGFEFPWVLFPMVGWGIGILFHYMDTFGHSIFLGKNWEERKMREFLEEEGKSERVKK